eukprot:gene338-366_t
MKQSKKKNDLTETTRLLSHSVEIARETELISDLTRREMDKQGRQLEEAQEKLQGMEGVAEESHSSMRKLQFKIYQRRIFLWAVIVGLLFIIILMVYRLASNHGHLLPQ